LLWGFLLLCDIFVLSMAEEKHLDDLGKVIPASECYIIRRGKVLMFKRSESSKKFSGFWIGPGGHIDEGKDALKAAIREVEEETGVRIGKGDIKLKAIAIHHHLDLKEVWITTIFLTAISTRQKVKPINSEGKSRWISLNEVFKMKSIFPPSRFYFNYVLKDKPGILYTNIRWRDSQLVKVLSQRVDRDY
jgi:8-oxo-dGTP diphosphatase